MKKEKGNNVLRKKKSIKLEVERDISSSKKSGDCC
jgi:hypothetical protein